MGWNLWVPQEGSRNPVVQEYITDPKELEKLDRGTWLDDEGNFACWDSDFDFLMDDRFMRRYVLDANGDPVQEWSLLKWGRWYEKAERHVGNHYLPLGIHVSTVFLALDHGFAFQHESLPVLWETMIFGGQFDGEEWRYTSKEDALQGHIAALKMHVETGRCSTRTKKTLRKRVLPILASYGVRAAR